MKTSILVLSTFVLIFVFTKEFPKATADQGELSFQKADYYRTIALNYNSFVVSLLWIRTMVGFGEDLRQKKRNPDLIENGIVLAELDPKFTPIYNWFAATQINTKDGPKYSDFEKIDALMKIGVEKNDLPSLNYSAAMNHIGYNRNLNPEQKRHFFKKAAEFLKPVLHHPNAHPRIVSSYRYFKGGGHFRDKIDSKEEAEYLASILLTYDRADQDQESIVLRLKDLGYADAALDRKLIYQKEYELLKKRCCVYFGDELSMAYGL